MIADTAMAKFKLAPHDPYWFRDRATVDRVLDVVLDSPVGPLVRYAGIIRQPKKAPDRTTVMQLVATGQDDIFALQDAKRPVRMTAVLSIVLGALAVDVRFYAKELAQRPAAIDDLVTLGVALRECDVFLGLREGYVLPLLQSYAGYDFDREAPRAERIKWGPRSGAIVDLIDTHFHAMGRDNDSDPAEVRLARSDIPEWVQRKERDGLLILRWVDGFEPKSALDRACEAHEDWMDRTLSTM